MPRDVERGGQRLVQITAQRQVRDVDAAGPGGGRVSTSTSLQRRTEAALLPAQIEQLPDRCGFLKLASQPEWVPVELHV